MAFLTGPFTIKQGATSPPYRVLLSQADKTPVDLSQADHVHFVMRQRGGATPTTDAEANVLQQGDAITGTNVGWCEYDWIPADTATAGIYDVEFALYDINDQVYARVPSDSYLEVQILGNLSLPGAA
jgi:hypothetical protein